MTPDLTHFPQSPILHLQIVVNISLTHKAVFLILSLRKGKFLSEYLMKRFFFIIFFVSVAFITTAAYHVFKPQWILFHKGEDHYLKKEYSKAIIYYEPLTNFDFKKPEFLRHLGISYIVTGHYDKASSVYEKLIRIQPEDQEAVVKLAYVYVEQGNFNTAIDLLKLLLTAGSDTRLARIYLARTLTWSGRFDDAINEYRKVLGEEK